MSATATQDRTTRTGQFLDALDEAERRRLGRAELKRTARREKRHGATLVADAILHSPPSVARMFIWQLVRFPRRMGDATAERLLRGATVDPWIRVGRLSTGQREGLAERLRAWGDGKPIARAPVAGASDESLVVCAPFREWMDERSEELGGYMALSGCCGVPDRTLRAIRDDEREYVSLALVDKCFVALGWHLNEVYVMDGEA